MNRTLKVLGLGLFAALAMSAFAVMGASADITKHTGGHFIVEGATALSPVKLHGHGGNVGNPHKGVLKAFGSSVECTETYTGTATAETLTSITITPHYTNCSSGRIVRMNGCHYTFTVRDTNVSTLHNDVHFTCPVGKVTEVEAPGECVITFPAQTVTNAVTYTTGSDPVSGKHDITADFTAQNLTYQKHGLCEFLAPFGTGPHTGASLEGSATIVATDADNNPVGITATGTNGH